MDDHFHVSRRHLRIAHVLRPSDDEAFGGYNGFQGDVSDGDAVVDDSVVLQQQLSDAVRVLED